MKFSPLIETVSQELLNRNLMLVTAESCTGGLIAKLVTDRAGSSSVFDRGFVTYTNDSKIELLGVPKTIIDQYGAVSSQTAEEMAQGAMNNSNADIAVSVTGIAGPGGGSEEKPVGLVFIGISFKGHAESFQCHFDGNREDIREQTAEKAFNLILSHIVR